MKINYFAALCVFVTLIGATCSARSGEPEERSIVLKQAEAFYRNGDFESLDRLHSTYSDFLNQRTSSGAFKITLFFDGISNAKRNASEDELQQDIVRTRVWVDGHKASPLAYVLHASAIQAYGTYFRGGGFANTVTPQAWKIYEEYTKKSAIFLAESEDKADGSTTWHSWMLNLARTAGWPESTMRGIFEEGIKKNPADFRLYRNALEYLLPKWQGDVRAVDIFIRYALTKAPSAYGAELYARLYSAAGESQFERRLYTESLVDWEQMKAGLELWNERFPTFWNKNILAFHACIAGDQVLTKRVLGEIGPKPQWEVWQPRAEATFATCTRWANGPEVNPPSPEKAPAARDKLTAARPVGSAV